MILSRLQKGAIFCVVGSILVLLCIPWISFTIWNGDVGHKEKVSILGFIRHVIFDSQNGPIGPPLLNGPVRPRLPL